MKALWKVYDKTSIKKKWIILVLILVLYPMILIGYVGYANYEDIITKHFIQSVQKDVEVVSEQFKERLEDIEQFIQQIQYDSKFYKVAKDYYLILKANDIELNQITTDEAVRKKYDELMMDDYELKTDIDGHLQSLMLSRQEIDLGAFQFVEGEDFGYIESKHQSMSYNDYLLFQEQDIFGNMKKKLEDGKRTAYYIDEKNNIYIGQKLYYRNDGKHFGNIIFRLDMEYLLKGYHKMLEGAKEAVYVLANDEVELLAIGNIEPEKKERLIEFTRSNPEESVLYKEEKNKESVIYMAFNTEGLFISNAVYISNDILLSDIRAMSRFIFMLCLSILPIFLLLANKLYKEVIYPIYVLSDKMQQIEKGELGKQIVSDRTDEFGYVFAAFNRMSKQIQHLVNCVYKEKLALKNAEIKSLQAQINPHFIYNTLEMINWKARMSGNDDISEMIEALSGILEINIDRRDSRFLMIQEEIDYIKNYIFLIQKRFGERIQFKLETSEDVLTYKIPRLILQPLVENAIGHGIEPVGQGCIVLRIEEELEHLTITIEDNGQGIEKNKLIDIQEQLGSPDKVCIENEHDTKGHIGIINVQRRIKLLYGEGYGMNLYSEWEQGTRITIVLPKTKSGELT